MKVRFINFERTKLPEEILRHNLEEKRKYFADISIEVEKSDAEVQVNVTDNPPPLHPHPGGKKRPLLIIPQALPSSHRWLKCELWLRDIYL